MIEKSVREVKNGLSEVIRLVSQGETVVILSRGVPVAQLVATGTASPKRPKAKAKACKGTPTATDEGLSVLRYLLNEALEAVDSAPDERTKAVMVKEARTLTERIGAITGDLRPHEARGDIARFERMPPDELLGVVEQWADDLRKVVADG